MTIKARQITLLGTQTKLKLESIYCRLYVHINHHHLWCTSIDWCRILFIPQTESWYTKYNVHNGISFANNRFDKVLVTQVLLSRPILVDITRCRWKRHFWYILQSIWFHLWIRRLFIFQFHSTDVSHKHAENRLIHNTKQYVLSRLIKARQCLLSKVRLSWPRLHCFNFSSLDDNG